MSVPRAERIREDFKRETSDILRKMKDPRIGFVSVTDVEMSRDLRHAKIYVSIFGDDEAKAQTLEALHHAQGFVRSELGRRIRLRHTPEISFRLDDSIERGHRINRLLRELAPEPQAAQSSEGREAGAPAEPHPAGAREEDGDESR